MSLSYNLENDCCVQLDINNDGLIWVVMFIGTSLFTIYLWNFMVNYITSGLFKQAHTKQRVYIVRSMLSQNLEDKIVEYINQNNDRPHKILSHKMYDDELNNISERTFLRFMKKLYNTNCDIFVLTTNNHRSSYDNYIYFSEILKVDWKIIDFVCVNSEEHKNERRIFDYENRERIVLELIA
jgi:hypothetical protein